MISNYWLIVCGRKRLEGFTRAYELLHFRVRVVPMGRSWSVHLITEAQLAMMKCSSCLSLLMDKMASPVLEMDGPVLEMARPISEMGLPFPKLESPTVAKKTSNQFRIYILLTFWNDIPDKPSLYIQIVLFSAVLERLQHLVGQSFCHKTLSGLMCLIQNERSVVFFTT